MQCITMRATCDNILCKVTMELSAFPDADGPDLDPGTVRSSEAPASCFQFPNQINMPLGLSIGKTLVSYSSISGWKTMFHGGRSEWHPESCLIWQVFAFLTPFFVMFCIQTLSNAPNKFCETRTAPFSRSSVVARCKFSAGNLAKTTHGFKTATEMLFCGYYTPIDYCTLVRCPASSMIWRAWSERPNPIILHAVSLRKSGWENGTEGAPNQRYSAIPSFPLPKLIHLSQVAVKVIRGGASSLANDFTKLDMVCFI